MAIQITDPIGTMNAIAHAMSLVADPETWTTGAIARDAAGKELPEADSPGAVRWCGLGALQVANAEVGGHYAAMLQEVGNGLLEVDPASMGSISGVNDGPCGRSHVLDGMGQAIRNLARLAHLRVPELPDDLSQTEPPQTPAQARALRRMHRRLERQGVYC